MQNLILNKNSHKVISTGEPQNPTSLQNLEFSVLQQKEFKSQWAEVFKELL
jgi:hypothetical protein